MSHTAHPAPHPARAAAIAAFFLPLAVLPWLNPVAGGAVTPAIPLLTGWVCMAVLFAGLPVQRASQRSLYVGLLLVGITLAGFAANARWQILALGLLMIGTAAIAGMRLVQDPALQPCTPLPSGQKSFGIALIAWSWLLAGLLNACIGLLQHFQHTAWLAGLLLAYLATAYVLPHLYGGTDIALRLAGQDSRACISRTVLWGNVLYLIAQKPLTGWGWGELDFAHYSANYTQTRFCDMLDNAHNLPLHLAVELGVPMAVLACGATLWWLVRQRPWAEPAPARQLAWGVLSALGIHSLLEYPLWYAPFQMACGLALGLLAASSKSNSEAGFSASKHKCTTTLLRAQHGVAAILLLGLAYACFDFVRVTQLYTAAQERVWPFKQNTQAQADRSRLFQNAVLFAKLSTEPVTPQTAATQLAQAQKLMHYSPEIRVARRIITCLQALGRNDEAQAAQAHLDMVYPPKKGKTPAEAIEDEDEE